MSKPFEAGDLIIYPYRWLEEARAGRSPDGAKERPCCVVISVTNTRGEPLILLAPISSKPPRPGQTALEIPDIERRRAGLTTYDSGWVYVGEMNQDEPNRSWYLEPQTPIGAFSRAFVSKIAAAARLVLTSRKVVNQRG